MRIPYETRISSPGRTNVAGDSACAILSIDLNALENNFKILQKKAGNAEVAGVVKADAYGLGAAKVASVLKELGCSFWFVANMEEGLALRKLLGKTGEIAILAGCPKGQEEEFKTYDLIPVLNSLIDIEDWCSQSSLPAILHFDTGINRLGLGIDETRTLLFFRNTLKSIKIRMVMSYFACADSAIHPFTEQQYQRISDIADQFPDTTKSLANSAGLFADDNYIFDLVRPGYALYGGNPACAPENPMNPVVRLQARVLQTRRVNKGESTGYGASHVFGEEREIATLSIGYADGFFRCLGNNARVFWKGHACPVIGRVSMDLSVVDITDIPTDKPEPGDYMEVLNSCQSIENLADNAGTIGYEILTSLGNRYERRYIT